jgi:hypothetical protein
VGNCAQVANGIKTRDIAVARTGFDSPRNYEGAKKVVETVAQAAAIVREVQPV